MRNYIRLFHHLKLGYIRPFYFLLSSNSNKGYLIGLVTVHRFKIFSPFTKVKYHDKEENVQHHTEQEQLITDQADFLTHFFSVRQIGLQLEFSIKVQRYTIILLTKIYMKTVALAFPFGSILVLMYLKFMFKSSKFIT